MSKLLAEEHFASILEKSLTQRQLSEEKEQDGDNLFCMSLYGEIKRVPEFRRLQLKISIYNLILHNQTQPSPHYFNSVPPRQAYALTSHGQQQQYMPNNGYPRFGYTADSHYVPSGPSQGSFRDHMTIQNNRRNIAGIPLPASANNSEASQKDNMYTYPSQGSYRDETILQSNQRNVESGLSPPSANDSEASRESDLDLIDNN